jgi:DNA-binding CsgD family transcriptional regulator
MHRNILLESTADAAEGTLDFPDAAPLCGAVPIQPAPRPARPSPVSRLTAAERLCLHLVYRHMTSKDMARLLGCSSHTVDMRLRTAMRKLNAASRIEAARMAVAEEAANGIGPPGELASLLTSQAYQPLIYQPPEIGGQAELRELGAPASDEAGAEPPRSSDPKLLEHGSLARPLHPSSHKPAAGPVGGSLAQSDAPAGNAAALAALAMDWPGTRASDPGIDAWPFLRSQPWGAVNDLSVSHRLGWILAIAFGSALMFGGILAALAALKALI